ncbi:5'-methylthioadenosine/S-adenosylhomocysteine nucleosidase family protein [Alkalispirochaeta alkalica]|uniref:5'-methylthioadenosine/S-adenosylhomocysteine nucleosidase family protein n=1 Tax=Alkalispirochaeta alkalica TaxID=46356 RepID=UPI00037DB0AE|nr:hypothetical protein [Alkalispirochaeta alkalica]
MTALPLELAPLVAPWGVKRPRPGQIYRGRGPGGGEIAACCSGPGTIAAALGAAQFLARVRPPLLVMGGIAAAGGGGAAPGDLVLADRLGFYGVDVTALGAPAGALRRDDAPEREAPLSPDLVLGGDLPGERPGADLFLGMAGQIRRGLILTGDCFLDARLLGELPPVWQERIARAQAVDMESAAWAAAADREGVPWLAARYISDDPRQDRRLSFPESCRRAGEILGLIPELLLPCGA